MPRAAAFRPTCPARSPTARCSTPTTLLSTRRSQLRSLPLQDQHASPTPPSAASAARRAWSRPSGCIDEIAYAARPRPARGPQAQLLRRRRAQRHALRPDGRGQRHPRARRRAGASSDYRARRAGDPRLQRDEPGAQARHRADAGQVRHLLHRYRTTTRPARWCTSTPTARPPEPRRHRDGPGPVHQGGAGGGRGVPGRRRPACGSPPPRPARCPTPRPPPPPPAPTSTARRRRRRRARSRSG